MGENPKKTLISGRRKYSALEDHATAIGYLCFEVAHLENTMRYFFNTLVGCSQEEARIIFDATGNSIASKCDLIINISRLKKPDDEWFNAVEAVLNHVKTVIAPKRNRFIHDQWFNVDEGIPIKVDHRVGVKKKGAHQPREMLPPMRQEVDLQTIWDIVNQTSHAYGDLLDLYFYRAMCLDGKKPLNECVELALQKYIDAQNNQG